MPRLLALFLVGFLVLAPRVLTSQGNAAPPDAGLRTREPFPAFSGKTLTGKSLELPAAALGKPAVLVFSFSRAAGKDAHLWNEQLVRGFQSVPDYDVLVMESVPKLFRGIAMLGVRSSISVSLQDRTIVLYQDERLWKQRLAASDNSRAYVVLLGADGHLRWKNSGAYTDSEYARLKREIEMLLQPHP